MDRKSCEMTQVHLSLRKENGGCRPVGKGSNESPNTCVMELENSGEAKLTSKVNKCLHSDLRLK